VLDLVESTPHRKLFDEAKDLVRLGLKNRLDTTDEKMADYRVFHIIDKKYKFDLIRALVDASRIRTEYSTYIVRRPQVQLCVKDASIIKDKKIVWPPVVEGYKVWTTE
jgi:hypothetical protein